MGDHDATASREPSTTTPTIPNEMRRDGKTVEPLGHGMKIDVWRAGSGPKEEMYAVVQHGASWQSTSGVRSVDTHRKGEVWHIPASSAVICIGARIRDRSPSRSPTLLLGSLMYFSDFQ